MAGQCKTFFVFTYWSVYGAQASIYTRAMIERVRFYRFLFQERELQLIISAQTRGLLFYIGNCSDRKRGVRRVIVTTAGALSATSGKLRANNGKRAAGGSTRDGSGLFLTNRGA